MILHRAVGLVGNGMGNIDTSDARYETIKTSGIKAS